MMHELKTWPEPYAAVADGSKTFELRVNDRGFREADVLLLREWDPVTKQYSGRELRRVVTYILRGPAFGLPEGMVIMSLALGAEP